MNYYLKPNVKIEPIIWYWYAWPHLIPPATAACNLVQRYIKTMESYIESPDIHAQAVKNPKLLGGPFIDLNGEKVEEVKELLDYTKVRCKKLIELEEALKSFDKYLQTEAKGQPLDELYKLLPEGLKGNVELVYDLNNYPSIRLIEALLYQNYYSDTEQAILLSEVNEDHRAFVLSTPYFEEKNKVLIKAPFSAKKLDVLFSMRQNPISEAELESLFDIAPPKEKLFKSFFTSTQPTLPQDRNYSGDDIRIRYFGHACILIETKDVSILIDPIISYSFQSPIERYTFNDLPDKIDYLLLTHNHQDHIVLESLLQLRYKVKNVVFPCNQKGSLLDPSLKLILKHVGFNSLITLDDMEGITLPDGEIIGLPFLGEHGDLNIQTKLAHYINLKGKKFVCAADTNNISPKIYDYIFDVIGKIDVLFLGMECDGAPLSWVYGPMLTKPLPRSFDKLRSLSGSTAEKAWPLVQRSGCKEAYIYAMGQEPWLTYMMALKYNDESPQIIESKKLESLCEKNGIYSARLFGKQEWFL